jgi:hypothetical protein
VFGTLSSAATARITVMRDGRQQELSINVAQAVTEAERISAEPAVPALPTVPATAEIAVPAP